jgi:autotransporter-associated beta strand protein
VALTVNANLNTTFGGSITDGAGKVSFTKGGADNLTLTGSNTYSGATSVNVGKLYLTTTSAKPASLGNTAITVASGAIFAATLKNSPARHAVNAGTTGAGTAGARLTLKAGSAFTMADGAIGTFNLRQNTSFAGPGLVIGGASGAVVTLGFDIGNAATGTDQIDVTKTASVLASGGKIAIDALAGDTSITAGNYNLITTAGGFRGSGGNGFTLRKHTQSERDDLQPLAGELDG